MTAFRIVVPARYASTRLPAKPLADICGKPMIVRVLERVRAAGAAEVLVATDHDGVRDAVSAAGGVVVMTRSDHPSGTDRLAEVAELCAWADEDIIVNVQGDEPLIDTAVVAAVAEALARDAECAIATAAHPLADAAEVFNPNVVKVVCDAAGRAQYFSRAPIPWARDAFAADRGTLPTGLPAYRHIGLYAYRAGFIRRYVAWAPTRLENIEMLEQLRVLWYGEKIHVAVAAAVPGTGVDTPEDLNRVRAVLA